MLVTPWSTHAVLRVAPRVAAQPAARRLLWRLTASKLDSNAGLRDGLARLLEEWLSLRDVYGPACFAKWWEWVKRDVRVFCPGPRSL